VAGEDGFEVYEGEGERGLVEDLETSRSQFRFSRRDSELENERNGLDEPVGLRGRGRSGSGRL
jgi:hypothetical protein